MPRTFVVDASPLILLARIQRSETAVLEQLRELGEDSPWALPSARSQRGRVENLNLAASRLREASGVTFRWHDLRHTAATMMTQMGIPRLVVGKVLNGCRSECHRYPPSAFL
ncbi:MAG: tyrosine-type recombinase/integrase [Thermoanaerobaculia bacterium]|nr:tyrosine-type recombinase/integrase [Thermoanaerobaculia bacterium]